MSKIFLYGIYVKVELLAYKVCIFNFARLWKFLFKMLIALYTHISNTGVSDSLSFSLALGIWVYNLKGFVSLTFVSNCISLMQLVIYLDLLL